MKKCRFSDEQIVKILSSVTGDTTVREVCQSHGVSENTFYTWKRKAVQHFVCKLSSLGQLTGGLLSPLLGSGRSFPAAIRH